MKKMSSMDEEPAVFEQLILYEIKLWSSISLKTFNNYSIIKTNINNNIRTS